MNRALITIQTPQLRGRRYGLCGGNGVGKSTLMRAISRGQLEGFPHPDVLKTVYVEHDIQANGLPGRWAAVDRLLTGRQPPSPAGDRFDRAETPPFA